MTGEMNLALAAVDTAKFSTAATKKAVNSSIFSRSPKSKPQNKNDCFDIHKVSLDTFQVINVRVSIVSCGGGDGFW